MLTHVALLAGGASARMGRDKALLQWHGETLLERSLRVIAEAGLDATVVGRTPPSSAGWTGVPDSLPGQRGPLAGLVTAVAHVSQTCDDILVLAVDMPLLQPDTLHWLLSHELDGHAAIVPSVDGRDQFCCARYACSAARQIDLDRTTSMHAWLAGLQVSSPQPPAALARTFTNVNTPEQLAKLVES